MLLLRDVGGGVCCCRALKITNFCELTCKNCRLFKEQAANAATGPATYIRLWAVSISTMFARKYMSKKLVAFFFHQHRGGVGWRRKRAILVHGRYWLTEAQLTEL